MDEPEKHMCDECAAQIMQLTEASVRPDGDVDWVFTCGACGWRAVATEGFWDQWGRWNRRSGALR